ncbi:hypothetical protein NDU88_004553 [Pleurodeles waltl]|uniref:Uncharacterized protein n=1 Tax=Pleurodeles waltl TaxID=8319 RepID=A0AAV7VKQ7_PLEWA|nr:hypothetical protein NDU88_004553 [Pleurodeles waltl]
MSAPSGDMCSAGWEPCAGQRWPGRLRSPPVLPLDRLCGPHALNLGLGWWCVLLQPSTVCCILGGLCAACYDWPIKVPDFLSVCCCPLHVAGFTRESPEDRECGPPP